MNGGSDRQRIRNEGPRRRGAATPRAVRWMSMMASGRVTASVALGTLLAAALALSPRPAFGVPDAGVGDAGASFDCAKAASRLETMICADAEASSLDRQLAKAYQRLLSIAADPAAVKAEQRHWLHEERGRCADVPCVRQAYQMRLAALAAAEKAARGPAHALAGAGAKAGRTHWVQIRVGRGTVCEAFRDEVEREALTPLVGGSGPVLVRPDWKTPGDEPWVPEELKRGNEETDVALFDFDNDGVPDRVFAASTYGHYMQGSILYVQLGAQPKEPWYLPCQLDARRIPQRECPPFSQNYDEAGLEMTAAGARKILFRGRYVDLTPLQLAGTTFVLVETIDERTRDELAVIKPRVGKTFEPVCLLHRGKHLPTR
jgi:uncharacterized protein